MQPLPDRYPDGQPFWVPNTNVFISDTDQLVVQVELSSMRCDNLEITIEENRLQVSGNRANTELKAAKTVLLHEMYCGPFESVMALPVDYDLTRAHASYLNGVLSIFVPLKGPPPLSTREITPFNPS